MKYGVPYKGSKNSIAKWVVEHLPPADTLVDVMAGGCAVTHAALLSGKYERVVANDISDAPRLFADAIHGKYRGWHHAPDRAEFHANKATDPLIGLVWSFANNREDYLYGRRVEKVKHAAEQMILEPDWYGRLRLYRQFISTLAQYLSDIDMTPGRALPGSRGFDEHHSSCHGLRGLQSLEALSRLQGLEQLHRVREAGKSTGITGTTLTVSQTDYRTLPISDGDTILYVDPPYANTNCGSYTGFDHNQFNDWLHTVEALTVVSEYTAPADCTLIASRSKQVRTANTKKTCENLYVPTRQLDEYRERMRCKE